MSYLNLYGQQEITKQILKFNADCIEVMPEEGTEEFRLLDYQIGKSETVLSFKAIDNCAQTFKGRIFENGDTLLIKGRNERLVSETKSTMIDSLGNKIYVTELVYESSDLLCYCLICYNYTLQSDVRRFRFLKLENRVFELK